MKSSKLKNNKKRTVQKRKRTLKQKHNLKGGEGDKSKSLFTNLSKKFKSLTSRRDQNQPRQNQPRQNQPRQNQPPENQPQENQPSQHTNHLNSHKNSAPKPKPRENPFFNTRYKHPGMNQDYLYAYLSISNNENQYRKRLAEFDYDQLLEILDVIEKKIQNPEKEFNNKLTHKKELVINEIIKKLDQSIRNSMAKNQLDNTEMGELVKEKVKFQAMLGEKKRGK